MKYNVVTENKNKLNFKSVKTGAGFTLMEIIVATVLFAVVVSSLLSVFNYVLRINRRSEALRQASQGMRDFVEYLVKEIRNGQIDYGYADPGGITTSFLPAPCSGIVPLGYAAQDNKLGFLDTDNNEVCLYYAKADKSYIGNAKFSSAQGGVGLVLAKGTLPLQVLNPPNFKVEQLMFLVRPLKDPYSPGNSKLQPFVSMVINFKVLLPTGEQVPIYYQTSVSTSKYDVPNSTQCSDNIDNDSDSKIDAADPQCHTDGNASNPATYDPTDSNESS